MAQAMNVSTSLLRAAGLSAAALVLAACSALPTPPVQPTRYDLGVTDTTVPAATAAAPSVAPPPLVLAEVQTPAGSDNSTAMLYRLSYADNQEQRAYQQGAGFARSIAKQDVVALTVRGNLFSTWAGDVAAAVAAATSLVTVVTGEIT